MFMNDLCSRKSMRLLCIEPLVTEKMSWNRNLVKTWSWNFTLCCWDPCSLLSRHYLTVKCVIKLLPHSEGTLCGWRYIYIIHRHLVLHCWLVRLTRKIVFEMTNNVSSGTLNPTVPVCYVAGISSSSWCCSSRSACSMVCCCCLFSCQSPDRVPR